MNFLLNNWVPRWDFQCLITLHYKSLITAICSVRTLFIRMRVSCSWFCYQTSLGKLIVTFLDMKNKTMGIFTLAKPCAQPDPNS